MSVQLLIWTHRLTEKTCQLDFAYSWVEGHYWLATPLVVLGKLANLPHLYNGTLAYCRLLIHNCNELSVFKIICVDGLK
jgi:hypothetical protein